MRKHTPGVLNQAWLDAATEEIQRGEFITAPDGSRWSVVALRALLEAALYVDFYATIRTPGKAHGYFTRQNLRKKSERIRTNTDVYERIQTNTTEYKNQKAPKTDKKTPKK